MLPAVPGGIETAGAADLVPAAPAPATGRQDGADTRNGASGLLLLFARVRLNTIDKGDVPIVRDARGHTLVPLAELRKWGIDAGTVKPVVVDGESYVDVLDIPGVSAEFDADKVVLNLRLAPNLLPPTTINLGPQRRANVIFTEDTSVFLNYGFNASGDDAFNDRQYQFATEFAARSGHWLFYNTTSQQWGATTQDGFLRLLTNVQYDDRPNLRTYVLGDFFTPTFDLNISVPMAGVGMTKMYSMDPYFVQYPTAAFATELQFPSTVQVRIDGNLVAQRQVPPGPLDVTNVTNGLAGGQNVAVTIRDPFGREQTLVQPFFFATNVGLAQGLHEYSYNLGFLRRNYGIESNDYGDLAASAFHRYAFTNAVTAGLRGQATQDLYNIGPFGTFQSPYGIVAAGVSVGGMSGATGGAGSAAYSYTAPNVSVSLGALYRSRDYAQLADLATNVHQRSNQFATGTVYSAEYGALTATYSGISSYDAPDSKLVNLAWTKSLLGTRGLLSVNYVRTIEPQTAYTWLLSFRYYFDQLTSVAAAVGGSGNGSTQAITLSRTVPQGEGVGYEVTAGRFDSDAPDGMFGRGFVQWNTPYASVGGEYAKASRPEAGSGLTRLFVAGSIGGVGGRWFASRPVLDSFALVSVPDLPNVPVYSNGWLAGTTDRNGEIVATNIASYYDNFLSFSPRDVSLDYVFPTSEIVISPSARSGSLVTFDVHRNYGFYGSLVAQRAGTATPIEFAELVIRGAGKTIQGFTARRGEFYVDGLTPGTYVLEVTGAAPCRATLTVEAAAQGMRNVGAVTCEPVNAR